MKERLAGIVASRTQEIAVSAEAVSVAGKRIIMLASRIVSWLAISIVVIISEVHLH